MPMGVVLANVDVVPIGKDRLSIITGHRKMFDFEDGYFILPRKVLICTTVIRKILLSLVKWALRPTVSLLPGHVFFLRG